MTASRQAFRNLTTKAPRIFGDEVSLRYSDGIALITMCGVEGELPWGTKREEHRWNPPLVKALNLALDATEQEGEASAVVVANEGRFWSNGFDLKFVDAHNPTTVAEHGVNLADLMARILCFPLPTIAAFSGHWCAAGGMMGLSFDYRVMATDRGFFFIPGVDLGLVYSPGQMALMAAKLPQNMHREVILFNTRKWTGEELLAKGVVDAGVPADEVTGRALQLAAEMRPKGQGPARLALGSIKRGLYKHVLQAFEEGKDMDLSGRSRGVDRAAPTPASKL